MLKYNDITYDDWISVDKIRKFAKSIGLNRELDDHIRWLVEYGGNKYSCELRAYKTHTIRFYMYSEKELMFEGHIKLHCPKANSVYDSQHRFRIHMSNKEMT